MRELALLNLLKSGRFAEWLRDARLVIDLGAEQIAWSAAAVLPWHGEPADATLRCSSSDLEKMLNRESPEHPVVLTLGERDAAGRVKHAKAVLAATCLGWMGPIPDASAPIEVERMARKACLELAVGPADGVLPLFSDAAPPEFHACRIRVSERARRRWCTFGLADGPLHAELWGDGEVADIRRAAAALAGETRVPTSIELDAQRFRLFPAALASARGDRYLVEVRRERAG